MGLLHMELLTADAFNAMARKMQEGGLFLESFALYARAFDMVKGM